jgi:tetratricopeptide (TPR) repeat protein/predicted Ser/Thr protein kinase
VASSCLDEDFALALVEQRIDDASRRAALQHAARCEDCRRLLAALVRAIPTTTEASDDGAGELVELGTVLGPYVIEGWLGRGGVGVVYLGRDVRLDRNVAIKLLARTDPNAALTRRFVREARILARLSHPNIVGVHDVGHSAHGMWIAMELVDGETLDAWLRSATRTSTEVLGVFRQAAAGLTAAHASGIVHRDFKPHNVMVGRDARVRVLDFGLAAAVEPSSNPDPLESTTDGRTGVVGTPSYMAPEQFAGVPADARSDQFSFCVSLWEALVGARPFAGDSFHALAVEVSRGRVLDPGRRMPARIEAALRRGLAVDPAERFATMPALVEALDRAQRSLRARIGLTVGSALCVALIAASVGAPRHEPCDRVAAQVLDDVRTSSAGLPVALSTPLRERADAWAEAFHTTCESDRASPSATSIAALACLDDRRAEIQSLVGALEPDARDPESVVDSLTPLEVCDDPARAGESTLPPEPERARRVVALRQKAAAVRAQAAARRDMSFRGPYLELVDEADAIGWPPLQGRIRFEYGHRLAFHGAYAESIPILESAYFLAKANNDRKTEFDAALELLSNEGSHLQHVDAALAWARHAEAALTGIEDPLRLSDLYKLRGELLMSMGDPVAGEAYLRRAVEVLPADARPFDRATTYAMLGNVLASQQRYAEALPYYDEALAIEGGGFGRLQALNGRGVCELQLGRPKDAIVTFEAALAAAESEREPANNRTSAMANLAILYGEQGDIDKAIELLEQAHGLSLATLGPYMDETRINAYNLALYHLRADRIEVARWWAERVLDESPGQEPSDAMRIQAGWALMQAHRRAGRMRESIAAWQERIAVVERQGDPDRLAEDLEDLAELCDEAGRAGDARTARQRAADVRATIVPESPPPADPDRVGA